MLMQELHLFTHMLQVQAEGIPMGCMGTGRKTRMGTTATTEEEAAFTDHG